MTMVRSLRSDAEILLDKLAKIESIDLLRFSSVSQIREFDRLFQDAMKFSHRIEQTFALLDYIKSRLFTCLDPETEYEQIEKKLFIIRNDATDAVKELFENPKSIFNSLFNFYKLLAKVLWIYNLLSTLGTDYKKIELEVSNYNVDAERQISESDNLEKDLRILNTQTRRFEDTKNNIAATHQIVSDYYTKLDNQISSYKNKFTQDVLNISREVNKFFSTSAILQTNINKHKDKITSASKNTIATFANITQRVVDLEKKLKKLNLDNVDTDELLKDPLTLADLESVRKDFEDQKKLDVKRLVEYKEKNEQLRKEQERLINLDTSRETENILVQIDQCINKIIDVHAEDVIYSVPIIHTPDLKLGHINRDTVATYQLKSEGAKNQYTDAIFKIEEFLTNLKDYKTVSITELFIKIKQIFPELIKEYKVAYENLKAKLDEKWRDALLRGMFVKADERDAWSNLYYYFLEIGKCHLNGLQDIQDALVRNEESKLAENEVTSIRQEFSKIANAMAEKINPLEIKRKACAQGVDRRDAVLQQIIIEMQKNLNKYRSDKIVELNSIEATANAELENYKDRIKNYKKTIIEIPREIKLCETNLINDVENKIKAVENLYQAKLHLLDQKERILQTVALNAIPTGAPKKPGFFSRHWGKLTIGFGSGAVVGAGVGALIGSLTSVTTAGLSLIVLTAIGAIFGALIGGVAAVVAAIIADSRVPVEPKTKTETQSTNRMLFTVLKDTKPKAGRKRTIDFQNTESQSTPPNKKTDISFDKEVLDFIDDLNKPTTVYNQRANSFV